MMKIELIITSVQNEAFAHRTEKNWANYEVHKRINKMIESEGWHVLCSVSGERIPYNDLRYWSVPLQVAWAHPEFIDRSQFGY